MSADDFEHILRVTRMVKRNPESRGVLSTGERLAVAMTLNRHDWLTEWKYTMAEAVDRLGRAWVNELCNVERAVIDDAEE